MSGTLPSPDHDDRVPQFVYWLPENWKKWVLRRFYPETQVRKIRQRY